MGWTLLPQPACLYAAGQQVFCLLDYCRKHWKIRCRFLGLPPGSRFLEFCSIHLPACLRFCSALPRCLWRISFLPFWVLPANRNKWTCLRLGHQITWMECLGGFSGFPAAGCILCLGSTTCLPAIVLDLVCTCWVNFCLEWRYLPAWVRSAPACLHCQDALPYKILIYCLDFLRFWVVGGFLSAAWVSAIYGWMGFLGLPFLPFLPLRLGGSAMGFFLLSFYSLGSTRAVSLQCYRYLFYVRFWNTLSGFSMEFLGSLF